MTSTTPLSQRREILTRAILAETTKAGTGPLSEAQQRRIDGYRAEIAGIEERLSTDSEILYQTLFERFLRQGRRALMASNLMAPITRDFFETRGTIGAEGGGGAYPGSSAGLTVPLAYAADVAAATKYAGPLMQLATVDVTEGGNIKSYPSVNDTAVTAALVEEASSISSQDITSGLTTLSGFKIASGVVKVSREAVEDTKIYPDLAGFLNKQFGIRFGRYINQKATVGVGTTEPTGYITTIGAAVGDITGANGNDGVSNSYNSIGTADFYTLQNALDGAYWEVATWQCHPQTLAVLCTQLDKEGRLLYPGLQNDTQTVNGRRVFTNAFLSPLPASGPNSPAVFTPVLAAGDFSKVVIRMATPAYVRLDETYALNQQIGFLAFTRVDSGLIDGGGGAVKYMNCAY